MPFVNGQYLQGFKNGRVTFLRQQQVQAFGCNNEYFGHFAFLPLPFAHIGIAVADAYFSLHTQFGNHFFHGAANVFGQCPQGCDPQQL